MATGGVRAVQLARSGCVHRGDPGALAGQLALVAQADAVPLAGGEARGVRDGAVDEARVLAARLQGLGAVDDVVDRLAVPAALGEGRVALRDVGAQVGGAARVALHEGAPALRHVLEVSLTRVRRRGGPVGPHDAHDCQKRTRRPAAAAPQERVTGPAALRR